MIYEGLSLKEMKKSFEEAVDNFISTIISAKKDLEQLNKSSSLDQSLLILIKEYFQLSGLIGKSEREVDDFCFVIWGVLSLLPFCEILYYFYARYSLSEIPLGKR